MIKNISRSIHVRSSRHVSFGSVIYEPRGVFGPRTQTDFQLVAVHKGEATITIDDAEQHLPAGDIALLKPGHRESFQFSQTTPTHHTWCAASPRRIPAPLAAQLEAAPFSLPLSARMQCLIELGLSAPLSSLPVFAALIEKLGDALLQEYLAQATAGADKASRLPIAVVRAKELIEAHLSDSLAMSDLAKAACCTPNHLTKLFRQHLRVTPARYLWQTRVNRGVEMLRQTGLSISEIADRTGFQTPFHFSRLVKQQHGASPKALRAQTWNAKRQ